MFTKVVKGDISIKSSRRDKLGIVAEILQKTKEGTLKTHILYKANLGFTQLYSYLTFMLSNNLITQLT